MSSSKVIEKRSAEDQLLARKSIKLTILQHTHRAVHNLKKVIYEIRNDIFKQQQLFRLKYTSYIELAMRLDGRLRRNKYCASYSKRVAPVKVKSAAAVLTFRAFDFKLKEAQKMTDICLGKSNRMNSMRDINLKYVFLETLDGKVTMMKEKRRKAVKIRNMFGGLKQEWIVLKEKLENDMDDCISKINSLNLEIYIKYGVMHE
ncbi:unnamed protein product [Orchesella dallaii]|uniref:Uncharacterized protein n=1 Tax=Orchesella dallaii TaxID=48710 RepID=A0ABP1QMV9_9HEXA